MNILEHNRQAWNQEVKRENRWTLPVSPEEIADARRGVLKLLLTPTKPTPTEWFAGARGRDLLCLASGGGQQGPLFAAYGANVTVFDNSDAQLAQDRLVAEREGLPIRTVQGDMRDLSCFPDGSFDYIFHPVSNCFVEEVRPVWKECWRVLRKGGTLMAAFCNPLLYLFDIDEWDRGNLALRYHIPYSDVGQLPEETLKRRIDAQEPLEYGHSLQDQIGGQLDAGFVLAGFYEDNAGGDLLDPYIDTFIATRALKL